MKWLIKCVFVDKDDDDKGVPCKHMCISTHYCLPNPFKITQISTPYMYPSNKHVYKHTSVIISI